MIEYQGYLIDVRPGFVVLGEDPTAEATDGFVADIRKPAAERSDDGHVLYDFPFDPATCYFQGATQDDVVAKAKAFIDSGGKRAKEPLGHGSGQ